MEANNRSLKNWYNMVQNGNIKLPRFQRFEAWDRHRIGSLLQTVINDLPLGITLVLRVGDDEKFISRFLETAPEVANSPTEHLLDGQQRITALWRTFHNNYEWETYYIYLEEFDNYDKDEERDDMSVFCRGRYIKKNGDRYPLWCDDPAQCLKRGFIPTDLLKPEDIQVEIDEWLTKATAPLRPSDDLTKLEAFLEYKKKVSDKIKDIRSVVANYNLPYLSLPSSTDKSVALDVFINMNTNSKPLSQYDIVVAEVENVMGRSLHDLQDDLEARHPEVSRYANLSDLILTTSALLQGYVPNQKGAWDMNKRTMVDNWNVMEKGLKRMAEFLRVEGIFDAQRLPTNAVLAVIAALYSMIPESGDKRGQDELLLKKYVWYAFFTDRYENSAASYAFSDFNALKAVISGQQKDSGEVFSWVDVPIFSEFALPDAEELITADWPKRASIRGRAVLAVFCRLGAMDFATGEYISPENVGQRHYHHVYPDALLKEAEINSFLALNCSLIADKTNMSIGRKDPVVYLKDRYKWTSQDIVEERLHSHLIPIPELANGGYEKLSDEEKTVKLKADFDRFLQRRAELVARCARLLADGKQLSSGSLFVAE